ncbi:Ppx/GppA phosphatase family protein [Aeromicrobium massiliense]|uniref:Ppx/GppA phosphatase family protein n=1 Tax=Aeromicrobium massiliense TaxID=1464554 RepID=UPI00031DFFD1|nr:Ppx/GppA phosphatase family protein [Aeromicrobium massiliense]
MRMGVLDIGSNTGHLLVVDAHRGGPPVPAHSYKEPLRLAEHLDLDNAVTGAGVERLVKYVAAARELAEQKGCKTLLPFATSAVRDAVNADEVLTRVRDEAGVDLEILSGEDEARLTFLAVRRWFGWSAGRLGVFDIGGGSLEVAAGTEQTPDVAQSQPLGAGRLTRGWIESGGDLRELRRHVRATIADGAGEVLRGGRFDRAVATSKTFRSLARMCGAAPSSEGMYARRALERSRLVPLVGELATMSTAEVATMPGVSADRAHQMLAGAVVADAVMDIYELETLEICPWALREGVILEHLDHL